MNIIVQTHNRKELTGITLDSVMACKHRGTKVHVLDDSSTDYDAEWLMSFGIDSVEVVKSEGWPSGCMKRKSVELGVSLGEFFLCLDNDALVIGGFDSRSSECYSVIRDFYETGPVIFSPYRSSLHDGCRAFAGIDRMVDVGGIALAMDVPTGQHLLSSAPEWGRQWDYKVLANAMLFAPSASFIEHIGRHGKGVNAPGADRGLDFIGYNTW